MRILLVGERETKFSLISELVADLRKIYIEEVFAKQTGMIHISAAKQISEKINFIEGTLYLESIKIPDTVQLLCTSKTDTPDQLSSLAVGFNRMIIISGNNQYASSSLKDLIMALFQNSSTVPSIECSIVFYRNIQGGATDIGTEEQAILRSVDSLTNSFSPYIRSWITPVIIYKSSEPFTKVLHPPKCCSPLLGETIIERFQSWRKEIEDPSERVLFRLQLSTLLDIDAVDEENNIFAFENVKGSKDLIKAYESNFMNTEYELYESVIIDYYREKISSFCIWNTEQSCQNLQERLKRQFHAKAVSGLSAIYPCPSNLLEYKRLLEKGFKERFKANLTEFFQNECEEIVFQLLNEKIERLSALLETPK